MSDPKNEFTQVTKLLVEAIGNPGSRTFRILVDSGSSSATVWLEKEQLLQLAVAIQELISNVPETITDQDISLMEREAPGLTRLDFKADSLALGHDEARDIFVIDAHDPEDEDYRAVTIRIWASREQVSELAQIGLEVCGAGRPICPLCSTPINLDGHICPRTNGHVGGVEI